MLGADGIFLPEAHGIELISRYAGVHQIILRGFGARIAQRNVIFRGATFVAISFDLQLVAGILLQNLGQFFRIRGKSGDSVGPQRVLIVVEIGVLNAADQLVNSGARGGVGIGGRVRLGYRLRRRCLPSRLLRSRRARRGRGCGGRRRGRRCRSYFFLGARGPENKERRGGQHVGVAKIYESGTLHESSVFLPRKKDYPVETGF